MKWYDLEIHLSLCCCIHFRLPQPDAPAARGLPAWPSASNFSMPYLIESVWYVYHRPSRDLLTFNNYLDIPFEVLLDEGTWDEYLQVIRTPETKTEFDTDCHSSGSLSWVELDDVVAEPLPEDSDSSSSVPHTNALAVGNWRLSTGWCLNLMATPTWCTMACWVALSENGPLCFIGVIWAPWVEWAWRLIPVVYMAGLRVDRYEHGQPGTRWDGWLVAVYTSDRDQPLVPNIFTGGWHASV